MRRFDLLIIGAGSGNSVLGPEHDDWDIAIAEHGLFGGTCLNVGCIPSKMFVYAAEVAALAADSERLGVHTRFDGADWPAVRDRIFGRIDPLAESGLTYRQGLPNVTVYTDTARFVGPRTVAVGDETITAERIVVAAGARPAVPDVAGLAGCAYHTSDTIMRLDALPERLLVLGGGYIAAELGSVMGAFGTQVTLRAAGRHLPAPRGRRDPQALHLGLQSPLRCPPQHAGAGRPPRGPRSSARRAGRRGRSH